MTATDPARAMMLFDRIEADLSELRELLAGTDTPPPASRSEPATQGLSTAEAARRFERSERQIRRLCKQGAGTLIGANWIVDPARLRAMLNGGACPQSDIPHVRKADDKRGGKDHT